MAVRVLLFLLSWWVSSLVYGQAEAVIDGPTEMEAGNLVVLNSVASKGDAKEWIFPENLKGRYIQLGDQVVFSVRESASFTFILVAVEVSEEVQIDTVRHTVVITNGIDSEPPTNPGDPPNDPPTGDLDKVKKLSQEAAKKLADPSTARALASAIRKIKQSDLVTMKTEVAIAVESVFLSRKGVSRDKNWSDTWRRPVSESINPSSPEEYSAILRAIADGLESA